jgi:hypothetical protein
MATTTRTVRRVPAINRLALKLLATTLGRRLLPGVTALRFIGRRSGLAVTLPVGYARNGDEVVVLVGQSAGKRWWRNFRGGHPVKIIMNDEWRCALAEVVTVDHLEYSRLLAVYRATYRRTPVNTRDPIVHIVLPREPGEPTRS